jgi:hypothetical protein
MNCIKGSGSIAWASAQNKAPRMAARYFAAVTMISTNIPGRHN